MAPIALMRPVDHSPPDPRSARLDRTTLITIGIALAALALAAPPTALAELAPDWPWLLSLGALVPIAILATGVTRLRDACLAALQARGRIDGSQRRAPTLPALLAILALTATAAILGPVAAIAPALLASLLAMLALLARAAAAPRLDSHPDLVDARESEARTSDARRAVTSAPRRAA